MRTWQTLFKDFVELNAGESLVHLPKGFLNEHEINSFKQIKKSPKHKEVLSYLKAPERKIFLKAVVNTVNFVPECFIETMVNHAVECQNPSFNKHYLIEPIRHNSELVFKLLFNNISLGNENQISGAYKALYWFDIENHNYTPSDEEQSFLRDNLLKNFAESSNIPLLRATAHFINFKKSDFSNEYQDLYDLAYNKAKNHKDDYIRNRFKLIYGNSNIFYSISD